MMTHVSFLVLHLGLVLAILIHDEETLTTQQMILSVLFVAANVLLGSWRIFALFGV